MRFYFLLSILILSFSAVSAQSPEKIYIHFDKDIYLPGETIWFKAYLFKDNQLSQVSTNFYTAIYDENGKLVEQKRYPIFNGVTNGEFELSDTITTSRLQFIAFTSLMWQTDSTKIYHRNIDVFQNENLASRYSVPGKKEIALQFFVEGGNAVEGVPNYFAYKANDADGQPAQIKGALVDQSNTLIDSFFTDASGLGKLQLIPQPNKIYSATWVAEGKTGSVLLPQIYKTGASLHIEQTKNDLHYVINKSNPSSNLNMLTLTAKMNEVEVYNASLKADNVLKLVNKIPLDSFANGLMEFELKDANNMLLQKRVVYINNDHKKPTVSFTEKSLEPKGRNTIEIQLPDSLQYNLSISITDVNFKQNEYHAGIGEQVWFNKNNSQTGNFTKNNMDLLILTNEWTAKKVSETIPTLADDYLNLVADYKNKNYGVTKTESLSLIISDTVVGKQYYAIPTVTQVDFKQSGLIFYDSVKVYYRLKNNKEDEKFLSFKMNSKINMPASISALEKFVGLDTSFNNKSLRKEIAFNNLKSFINPKPSTFNAVQTINEVTVKTKYVNPETKRILEIDNKYTSGMFSGVARGIAVNVLDDPKAKDAIDIYAYIKRAIPMLEVSGGIGDRIVFHRFRGTPILFIDERESDMNELERVSPTQVAYIKYVQGIVAGSSFRSSAGALYIYYRKGNEDAFSEIPKMRFVKLKGFDLSSEFTNPDYFGAEQLKKPDTRSTLYWNPYLTTRTENNKIKITYFNNDISKKLLLIIEGVSEDGNLIHVEKIIEVQ